MDIDDIDSGDIEVFDETVVSENKKTKRLRWTAYEEATLTKLAGRLPAEQIASVMGRTLQSVKMRANALKLSLKSRKTVWSKDRLDKLNSLKEQGMSWKEISKTLKCTEMACMKIYQRTYGTKSELIKSAALSKLEVVLNELITDNELKTQIMKAYSDAL